MRVAPVAITPSSERERRHPVRRPLPPHLPREEILHHPGDACPGCGGASPSKLGEDVTEVLERIPAQLKVIRHIRPRLSCRSCEIIIQAPAPDLPIEKGRPGPALIANVVVSKYIDGLPLYRQAGIRARGGVDIDRATLCDWVGRAAWWLAPVAEAIGKQVMAAPVIFTDDTPIDVLAPGNRRTRTGRIWTYVVDERPWAGDRPPMALYRYSQDRKGERPAGHLSDFAGTEIAMDAGYDAPDAFARAFRQRLGPIAVVVPEIRRLGAVACGLRASRQREEQAHAKTFTPDDVTIRDVSSTPVAIMEHRGNPETIGATIQRFIAWRKATGLFPMTCPTFTVFHSEPRTTAPAGYRLDLCVGTDRPIVATSERIEAGTIPGGRCAMLRVVGNTDNLEFIALYLYRDWLPASGE